ncbi:MAG: alpha/beta hydrolase family protein [Phycisphaerales bacterium]
MLSFPRTSCLLRPLPIILAAILLALASRSSVAAQQSVIPRDAYFGHPDYSQVQISPGGVMFGYLAPVDGALNIWIRRLGLEHATPVTRFEHADVIDWQWAHNDAQVIATVAAHATGAQRIYATTIEFGPDLDARGEVTIGILGVQTIELTPTAASHARLLAADRSRPDEVLALVDGTHPGAPDVWRINTRTGDAAVIFENEDGYVGFCGDAQLQVRAAVRRNPMGGLDADLRNAAGAPWFELARWNAADARASRPIGFSRDGSTTYVIDSRNSPRAALFALQRDAAGGSSYHTILADTNADVVDVLSGPGTGKPQAVMLEGGQRLWRVLDLDLLDDFAAIQSAVGNSFRITSRDHDDRVWIIETMNAGPPAYYLFNRRRQRLTLLCESRPKITRVAPTQIISFGGRGGGDMIAYLTEPLAANDGARRPLVVVARNDMWSRDHFDFNPVHQWLADRGYAAMSVNVRGSAGFGSAFVEAGHRELARGMHDDLIDAVLWAVDAGVADPDRIAMLGQDDGGFAALVGLTFTPNFFAVAIARNPHASLNVHVRELLQTGTLDATAIDVMMGPVNQPAFFASISPLNRVDAVTRPLLLGQDGLNAPDALAACDAISASLRTRGIPVTLAVFSDQSPEGRNVANDVAWYAMAEAFLARYLGGGGRVEPVASDVGAASLQLRADVMGFEP